MLPQAPKQASPSRAHQLETMGVFALGALIASVGWKLQLGPTVLGIGAWTMVTGSLAYALLKRSLTVSIMVSMVVGIVVGIELPAQAIELAFLSKIFLKLVKCIIAPLIFSTLVVGIAGHSSLRSVWRLAVKSLIYFELVTTAALAIGLVAINASKAGVGVQQPQGMEAPAPAGDVMKGGEIILHAFPENIAKSVAEGQILQVVVFAVLFAIALATLSEEHKRPMLTLCSSLSKVMFKFTGIVMLFAPIGVGSAIAYTVAHMGVNILVNLAWAIATLYLALAVFLLLVLLPIAWFAGIPLRRFLSAIATPVSIAFATTSSEAALPRAMEAMEKMGCPSEVVAFVMPTGYSMNLDGTTLYLSMAAMFVAQAAEIPMTIGQQLGMGLSLMIASKGVAGVPRASLLILFGMASSFGLPEWPIMVLMGVDVLMDMGRTSVNVIGNCLATLVIGRWEGLYDPKALPAVIIASQTPSDPQGTPPDHPGL